MPVIHKMIQSQAVFNTMQIIKIFLILKHAIIFSEIVNSIRNFNYFNDYTEGEFCKNKYELILLLWF